MSVPLESEEEAKVGMEARQEPLASKAVMGAEPDLETVS